MRRHRFDIGSSDNRSRGFPATPADRAVSPDGPTNEDPTCSDNPTQHVVRRHSTADPGLLEARLNAIDRPVGRWRSATDLATAQRAAEKPATWSSARTARPTVMRTVTGPSMEPARSVSCLVSAANPGSRRLRPGHASSGMSMAAAGPTRRRAGPSSWRRDLPPGAATCRRIPPDGGIVWGSWLARKDSNLQSPDPESGALPFGHSPAAPAEFTAGRRSGRGSVVTPAAASIHAGRHI